MAKQSKELKRALADKAFWQGFVKSPHWRLSGWTYRSSALFVHESGGAVDVTAAHLDLLGIKSASEDSADANQ